MIVAVVIIYLGIFAILFYAVVWYKRQNIIRAMKNGERQSIKIKGKVISIHIPWSTNGLSRQHFKFKVKGGDKNGYVYRSQLYSYFGDTIVKIGDSIDIYQDEQNRHYYYMKDNFIVEKCGLYVNEFKTPFIRFVSFFPFLFLLPLIVACFSLGIESILIIDRFFFVGIGILLLQGLLYLLSIVRYNKNNVYK